MANRLRLDWNLNTSTERADFINEYMTSPVFSKNGPTEEELETMANYVLWGKDEDGTSVVQRKEIELETRNSTWTRKAPESLDALLETPTFNENTIIQQNATRAKTPRLIFDRTKALNECPASLRAVFVDLFHQIDQLDLIINYYDLFHDKRKNPPRAELLSQFSLSEQEKYQQKASSLTQYRYLKLRHLLVELRKQQFTLRDTYATPIQLETTNRVPAEPTEPISFETDILVLPCGLAKISNLAFTPINQLIPATFSESQINQITKAYWANRRTSLPKHQIFDFTNLEHVYNLFMHFFDLNDAAALDNLDKTTKSLLDTLNYYLDIADVTDIQHEIIELKKQHLKNHEVAAIINQKHGKSYTANYISTIFRQKIIKQINVAAAYHERVIQNLAFKEEFKVCSTCGQVLLRDTQNFVRKTRAKDGFAGRCKICDKTDRQRKKELQEKYQNGVI